MTKFNTYVEAQEYQLSEWVEGRPWHNPMSPQPDLEGGECCPDFSCCAPSLIAPRHLRKKFYESSGRIRQQMLGMFLGGAVNEATKESDIKVHIAGDTPTETH